MMAKLCLHVLSVGIDFTIKCISSHTWILMQTTGSILAPKLWQMFLYSHDVPKHLDICGVTEERFKCRIGTCKDNPKGFKTIANLQSHHKGYHKLGEVHVCAECGFQTFHEAGYQRHVETH